MLMMNLTLFSGCVLAGLSLGCAMSPSRGAGASSKLKATNLRTEYHTNPLGLDVVQPRFSWVLESSDSLARDQKQSAYQILVASSREKLKEGSADLWDSKKIDSNKTSQIVYAGQPLKSEMQCVWAVRVWNGNGEAFGWSEPAAWTMGLLDKGDFKAKWIGYDEPAETSFEQVGPKFDLQGCKWLWSDKADAKGNQAKGAVIFRKHVAVPAGKAIVSAWFLVAADDGFELWGNKVKLGMGTDFHSPQMCDVSEQLRAGDNAFAIDAHNTKESPAGVMGRLRIDFASGEPLVVDVDETWKTSADHSGEWKTVAFDDSGWKFSVAQGNWGDQPWGKVEQKPLDLPPPPYLRKKFALAKPVKRATLYGSALGLYELHLNGQRVGDDRLTPGFTDYKKRVHYQTYDVTKMVQQGDNAIGAILADGWYAGYFGFKSGRAWWGDKPRLFAQLNVEYSDDSSERIISDGTWKARYGALQEADIYKGEAYDARKEIKDWDQPSADESKWQPVVVGGVDVPTVCASPTETVRVDREFHPKTISEPEPGKYIFDLGQNMVGTVRLKVNVPAGTRVTIRQTEMLNPNGTLYTTALRGARAQDTYIAKGTGDEIYMPRFTFHGFRYVEVSGLKSKPSLDTVTGVVIHTQMNQTGEFECSNPLVNQLFHNIIWGQKGNYLEVPTDCPQRDERLGWTGDAQFFVRTGSYNFDVASFFTKWLVDLVEDGQNKEGAFAHVAPDMGIGYGAVAWDDAGIICPWTIYRMYGDTRVIQQHWDHMTKYIDFLKNTSKNLVREQGPYGDWVNLGGGASSQVIGTSYFEYVTRLMSEMAGVIGKTDEAQKYQKLADDIKAVFEKNFVLPDGSIKDSSQTGYALAFTMGLIPPEFRKKSADKFVEEIKKKDWHLATGFIGTPRLLPGLTDAGRSDVAYRLLLTETFPSWLFPVKLGATTMWERWDGWHPDRGFQDPGMNSFNHYAFGSVGQYLYITVAGIDPIAPGFDRFKIAPIPGGDLKYAKASFESIHGKIGSDWKIDGDTIKLKVVVPINTTAEVHVPTSDPNSVKTDAGVKPTSPAVFELGSGTYEFTAKR
ncbi:MAG TPA: family 78 glycoside hydrolase catalytic domain [Tepidisphaeraceae bacterium]|nr:family 78 glycoside hydrolase catalytic domain [Tepidisphaeraceae bacterium]